MFEKQKDTTHNTTILILPFKRFFRKQQKYRKYIGPLLLTDICRLLKIT